MPGQRRFEMRGRMRDVARKNKGQSLLEFALVIPVLCIIFMGIFDFGWILHRQITLDNATRAGARRGAVGETTANIKNQVINSVYFPLTADQVVVTVLNPSHVDIGNPNDRTPDNYIVVEVTINDVQLITPLRNVVQGMGQINLHSRAEFLIE